MRDSSRVWSSDRHFPWQCFCDVGSGDTSCLWGDVYAVPVGMFTLQWWLSGEVKSYIPDIRGCSIFSKPSRKNWLHFDTVPFYLNDTSHLQLRFPPHISKGGQELNLCVWNVPQALLALPVLGAWLLRWKIPGPRVWTLRTTGGGGCGLLLRKLFLPLHDNIAEIEIM